jgi:apolipoprotein N-acyltransferase
MASALSYPRLAAAILVIAATATLLWFGNGLDPLWPLMWLAPLPVLVYALRSSWRSTAVVAFLAMLLGSTNLLHYFHLLDTPPVVWFSIFGLAALVFAAAVLLFRALVLRAAPWTALLALPALWVTAEYLRTISSPHGTAGSLAYTQLRFLPILQLASITGPWGISFLLLLFPATLAIALHLRATEPRQSLRILIAGLGVIAATLLFGIIRLAQPEPSQRVTVGLIASDQHAYDRVVDPGAPADRLFRDYAAHAADLAARGAKVIVLPEKLAVALSPQSPSDTLLQSVADHTGATLIAGVVSVSPPFKYNQARIYAPQSPVLTYDKQHMLPPFESDLKPGTSLTVLSRPSQTWAVAICKDLDFAQPARSNGHAGAGLLLVPAWDFNLDRAWHGHIALMRGVEDGFSIVRAAKNGYLTVSDDRGRILAETRSDSAPFATLLASVPAAHHNTLYLRLGDWFAWLSLTLCAATLLRLHQLQRKPSTPQRAHRSHQTCLLRRLLSHGESRRRSHPDPRP